MKQQTIKPKQIVNLSQLREYDRFCFVTNKKKVWQVVDHFFMTDFKGEQKRMTRCINDKLEKGKFDAGRSVIFLRRNDPNEIHSRIRRRKDFELIDY